MILPVLQRVAVLGLALLALFSAAGPGAQDVPANSPSSTVKMQ